jgi:hypothetical protein
MFRAGFESPADAITASRARLLAMRLLDARCEVAMLKQILAGIVVAAALAVAACSDSETRLTATGPSGLQSNDNPFSGAPFVGINPSALTSKLIDNSVACPAVQPFLIDATVVVRTDRNAPIFIDSIRMQFTDTRGTAAPDVTLTAPVPTRPFGTALDEARLLVAFRFGCGVGRQGTLVIIADTHDNNGRRFSNQVRATVR